MSLRGRWAKKEKQLGSCVRAHPGICSPSLMNRLAARKEGQLGSCVRAHPSICSSSSMDRLAARKEGQLGSCVVAHRGICSSSSMDRLAARKDEQLGFCVRGHLSVSVDYMESLSHSMPIYAYVFLVFFIFSVCLFRCYSSAPICHSFFVFFLLFPWLLRNSTFVLRQALLVCHKGSNRAKAAAFYRLVALMRASVHAPFIEPVQGGGGIDRTDWPHRVPNVKCQCMSMFLVFFSMHFV